MIYKVYTQVKRGQIYFYRSILVGVGVKVIENAD